MSEEEQRIANASATKDRKGIQIKLDVNNLISGVAVLLVAGLYWQIGSTHDDVLTLKAQIPALIQRINVAEGEIRSLWAYAGSRQTGTRGQVPTQDQ